MYIGFIQKMLILDINHQVNEAIAKGMTDEEILKLAEDRIPEIERLLKTVNKAELEVHLKAHYPGCYKCMQLLEAVSGKISGKLGQDQNGDKVKI